MRSLHIARPWRRRGQALVLALAFAAAAGLACVLLYDSAMLATTKTQLQNAADAGAYSAGLLLARDHNFSAYANRAMVANQVAVAQLVSLKSYLDDAAATQARMGGALHMAQAGLVPASKPAWTAAGQVPIAAAASAYADMAPEAVKSLDALTRAFDNAQALYHHATALNVLAVADDVVRRNDPAARITQGAFHVGTTDVQLADWDSRATRRYRANDAGAAADRYADTVVAAASTDAFTRKRASVPAALWASTPTALACPLQIPLFTEFAFAHGGGTLLAGDKRRWLALDATLGAGFVSCQAATPLGTVIVSYPLLADALQGGGSGGASSGASSGAPAGHGGAYGDTTGYRNNPFWARFYGDALRSPSTAVPAAARYAQGPGTSLDANGGLQDFYRDVGDFGTPANQGAAANGGAQPLTIEVEHRAAGIRSAVRVLGGAPATVGLAPDMKGATMRALASAHAYFYRARSDADGFAAAGWRRADGKSEMANLFNPYWQAQLVDRSDAQRLKSIGDQ